MKLWAGRSDGETNALADAVNVSLPVDARMVREDIAGSAAHAMMLAQCDILTAEENAQIQSGLAAILADIDAGTLKVEGAEDIHSFVENTLTARIGEAGKRLHTARSRNDQVALDLRLVLRGEIDLILAHIAQFSGVLTGIAGRHLDTILPGYTHLQRAQPVTLAHHLGAYLEMFARDSARLADCRSRMNLSPLGSGALAATGYLIDRDFVAAQLGFDGITANAMDGVSDRDFVIELLSALSILMMHLSRLAEEVILWCSTEFGFLALDDAFSTGSSIMPQKKNPDIAELVRGKTGRVYGALVAMLTVMKGLPLAYNKDLQEDKEAVFDAVDTAKLSLAAFAAMLASAEFKPEPMRAAVETGFLNATDCADYLTAKGVPFRDAYQVVGQLVAACLAEQRTLDTLPLTEYKAAHPLFGDDVYAFIRPEACVARRKVAGGPAPEAVKAQIAKNRNSY